MTRAHAASDTSTEDILDAADKLFFARGFDNVSVDEIRDAAQVSLKTLYRHFPSKTAIVDAYLARRDATWRALLDQYITERSSDPGEQILLAFDGLTEYLRGTKEVRHCAFQHAYAQVAGRPESLAIIRKHKRDLLQSFRRRARAAQLRDPDLLGLQLMLLFEGALVTGAMLNDSQASQAARAAAAALVAGARR